MDRDEAIRLLQSGQDGVEKWNAWRTQKPRQPLPDLSGANFQMVDFHGVFLDGVNLEDCNLGQSNLCESRFRGANLANAKIHCCDLFSSNLSDADLSDASLYHSNLCQVDLSGAKLCGADLGYARFQHAVLSGTEFTGAKVYGTIWGDVDLSAVKGLEQLDHAGESPLGIGTLLTSGELPDEFLLGCGVPETLLEYIKSLPQSLEPVQFYSCFISYSHQDEEFVQRLHSRLRQEGLRVWYAPEDMKGGRKVHHQIDEAIRLHDRLLLVLSEASMSSEWVATEIYKARQREVKEGKQVLFPIRLVDFERIEQWECFDADTGKDMAREIREYFVPDFTQWKDHDKFEESFERLLSDLKKSAEPAGS